MASVVEACLTEKEVDEIAGYAVKEVSVISLKDRDDMEWVNHLYGECPLEKPNDCLSRLDKKIREIQSSITTE